MFLTNLKIETFYFIAVYTVSSNAFRTKFKTDVTGLAAQFKKKRKINTSHKDKQHDLLIFKQKKSQE